MVPGEAAEVVEGVTVTRGAAAAQVPADARSVTWKEEVPTMFPFRSRNFA